MSTDDKLAATGVRVRRGLVWHWITERPAEEPDPPKALRRDSPQWTCIDCGIKVWHRSTRCRTCHGESRRKPPPSTLFSIEQPRTYRERMPHGTHTAFNRHKSLGEDPCEACVYGERIYQRESKKRRRERAVENTHREAS